MTNAQYMLCTNILFLRKVDMTSPAVRIVVTLMFNCSFSFKEEHTQMLSLEGEF